MWTLRFWKDCEGQKTWRFSKVHPEVLDERRPQYYPALRYIRETGPLRGNLKKMVGASGGKTVHGKRVGKTPPCPERILKTPLPQQSSPSSREEEGHLGRDGRHAQAEYRFREDGQENAEVPRRQDKTKRRRRDKTKEDETRQEDKRR